MHAYTVVVIRRTSINLDLDLVAEARDVLGTKTTTDTVHTALRDAVRRERLERLSTWTFEDVPPGVLDGFRETRTDRWKRQGPDV
jgi:Arc/MetJ family transcription regulator